MASEPPMAPGVGQTPRPVDVKRAQPNQAFTAHHDIDLAAAVESLWYSYAGSRKSFAWGHPDAAPSIYDGSVDTLEKFHWLDDTNTSLRYLDDNGIGWYLQKGADAIDIMAWVAQPQIQCTLPFSMRPLIGTVITSGTTYDSTLKQVRMQNLNADFPQSGSWRELENWSLGKVEMSIENIASVPSERVFEIEFRGQWDTSVGDPVNTSYAYVAKIVALQIRDRMQAPS